MADEFAAPRVLILDDGTESFIKMHADLMPQLEAAIPGDISINMVTGRYDCSARLRKLSLGATTEKYDLVIVGNNLGLGFTLCRMLSTELRLKTLVVWNDPPEESATWEYAELGFRYFGTRRNAGFWYNQQVELLRSA